MIPNSPEFRQALEMIIEDQKLTMSEFARKVLQTSKLKSFSPYTITRWLRGTCETLTPARFMALYPMLRPYLFRTGWQPSEQAKNLIEKYDAEMKQGDLFEVNGQTVDNVAPHIPESVSPVDNIAPHIPEPVSPVEEEDSGDSGSVHISCDKCNSALEARWETKGGVLFLMTTPCQSCIGASIKDALSAMVSSLMTASRTGQI